VLREDGRRYEVVCALEVVEHVPDRPAFLRLLSALVRPGGLLVISTIDRTLLSWLVAIVGGETILGVLPKGTHRWGWFVAHKKRRGCSSGKAWCHSICAACGTRRCSTASAGRGALA
jgi:2-polyprenyl-6-hydroxyphenyl methylase / 3-demethylubiquinone-9 3-methyltransferase